MNKKYSRVYLEITNICNLDCLFCPKTDRTKRRLSVEEFDLLTDKLRGQIKFLYFHLMGEPMLHPLLPQFIETARAKGFVPVLTTNGTLLKKQQEMLLASSALHKVNISLHAFESNDLSVPFEDYLTACFAYGKAAAGNKLTVFRLWNQGGEDEKNSGTVTARARVEGEGGKFSVDEFVNKVLLEIATKKH